MRICLAMMTCLLLSATAAAAACSRPALSPPGPAPAIGRRSRVTTPCALATSTMASSATTPDPWTTSMTAARATTPSPWAMPTTATAPLAPSQKPARRGVSDPASIRHYRLMVGFLCAECGSPCILRLDYVDGTSLYAGYFGMSMGLDPWGWRDAQEEHFSSFSEAVTAAAMQAIMEPSTGTTTISLANSGQDHEINMGGQAHFLGGPSSGDFIDVRVPDVGDSGEPDDA